MNQEAIDSVAASLRGKAKAPFFSMGNEIANVFLPIMGADSLAVYAYFKCIEYSNPNLTHSVRTVACLTGLSGSTISRSLEILEHLGLVKMARFNGCRASECELVDSRELAIQVGVKYHRNSNSFSLPTELSNRLKSEVRALRVRQQAKPNQISKSVAPNAAQSLLSRVSQRDASASLLGRQRATRGTRAGSHLLLKEKRLEDAPPPTPYSPEGSPKSKGSANEEKAEGLVWRASVTFTGVIDDLRVHLLDTNRPPSPHLIDGFADWEKFGFGSLAVEAVTERAHGIELTISAHDMTAARMGLEKYRRTWEASLRKWYGCEVEVNLQKPQTNQG